MIGIPGQTYGSVADDILLFGTLDLDMIGVGPYIAHPLTPLGDRSWMREIPADEQIPGDELTVYKVVALTRLVRPDANIPSTTALATINKVDGRELGLQRGANIVMPNLTPPEYRVRYEIYPDKACVNETAELCRGCLSGRIESIGRVVGEGPGGAARPDAPRRPRHHVPAERPGGETRRAATSPGASFIDITCHLHRCDTRAGDAEAATWRAPPQARS